MAKRHIRLPAASPLSDLMTLPETAAVAGPAAVPVGEIVIPDLSAFPTAVEKARHLLQLAAGIEHALLVQYLYAAYSITGSGDLNAVRTSIRQIAIEEMAHLLSVENLLLLVRSQPTLKRADRQQAEMEGDRIVPFDLTLESFSKSALSKYVLAEAPSDAATIEPTAYPSAVEIAGEAHQGMIKQVGLLYLLMGVVFGDEATLAARAGNSDWDARVKELADQIVAAEANPDPDLRPNYGGREGMHLKDADFATAGDEFLSRQATHSTWDRSPKHTSGGSDPFILAAPKDRDQALELLREISIQGEAPTATSTGDSHFRRFIEAFKTIYGADGSAVEPAGIVDVPTGSAIEVNEAATGDEAISEANSVKWARLADLRYAIMLGSLEQYLASPPDDRDFLASWCFVEMFHLKKLAEFLVSMPRKTGGDPATAAAAVPFNLPAGFVADAAVTAANAGSHTAWPDVIADWFTESIAIATELRAGGQILNDEQTQFLDYMKEVDARKLLEARIRRQGGSVRTTFDRAREIFEWATGTGDPRGSSSHSNKGRFWNRPLDQFKADQVFNPQGALAQIVNGGMPLGRPLNVEHQSEIQAIRDWVDAGCPENQPLSGRITDIKEIRILPSLAIGRLGSSPNPMHNYTLDIVAGKTYRQLRPAETLMVNELDGTIAGVATPPDVKFKDTTGRVKPVCPFLEVWAVYEDGGDLRPLTLRELRMLGLDPSALTWTVRVANLKAFRRTGQAGDRIESPATSVSNHARTELRGTGGNLKTSRSISFGFVRYIKPTDEFPEIRLRFTPAAGLVFGHQQDANIPAGRDVYDPTNGNWDNHEDQTVNPTASAPRARLSTAPGGIYATTGPPGRTNLGYLDDSCDGIVSVTLNVNGRELSAQARIASGPPDFAPDSLPVRTVADELEQALDGPDVTAVTADEVIDIVRRAVETVRAISLANQNDTFPFWQPAARNSFGNALNYTATVGIHQTLLTSLEGLRAPANSPERVVAHQSLERIAGAVRAFDQAVNYGNPGTTQQAGIRQMPALMRGADGNLLALTRRQRAKLLLAVDVFRPDTSSGNTPRDAMVRMIQALQFGSFFHGGITVASGATLAAVFATPDDVLNHIENGQVQGGSPAAAPFVGQPLVVAGQPDGSPFVQIVSNPTHRMNRELTGPNGYEDANTGQDGIEVIRAWIAAL